MKNSRRLIVLAGMVLLAGIVIALVAILLLQDRDTVPPRVPLDYTPSPADERLQNLLLDQAIVIPVGEDIQATIEQHPPGSVFIIGSGVHRMQRVTPRDGDIFIGEPGAILNGSRLLENFETEGDYWLLRDQPEEAWSSGECLDEAPRCSFANDLFIDDQPLPQAASLDDLQPGTWFFDYDNATIYLAADPANRVVELSTTAIAFESEASDVLIYGLTVEKYAGPGQVAPVRAFEGRNWRIERSIVRLNSAGGITVGEGTQVINSQIIRNGQIGVSGIGDNMLIEGNEIAYNNFAGYSPGWEAGGTKFVGSRDLVVRGNYVHHNRGPGLWTDGSNVDVLYEDNLVVQNAGAGIFHEISYDAVIRYNVAMYNAPTPRQMFEGGQIFVSSSGNTTVHDNIVVVGSSGGNAVAIVQQGRGDGELGPHVADGNEVHNNVMVMLHEESLTGLSAGLEDGDEWNVSGNQFRDNTYYILDDSHSNWGWPHASRTWAEWQELGQDADSTLLTDIPLRLTLVPAWRR